MLATLIGEIPIGISHLRWDGSATVGNLEVARIVAAEPNGRRVLRRWDFAEPGGPRLNDLERACAAGAPPAAGGFAVSATSGRGIVDRRMFRVAGSADASPDLLLLLMDVTLDDNRRVT